MSLGVRWQLRDPAILRTLAQLAKRCGWQNIDGDGLHLLISDAAPVENDPARRGTIRLGGAPAMAPDEIVLALPVTLATIARAIDQWLAQHQAAAPRTLGNGACFDPARRALLSPAGEQELTDKEARLLETILAAGEGGIARDRLLEAVWNYGPGIETHTLETHAYRLRQKMELAGAAAILSVEQGRYRLSMPA